MSSSKYTKSVFNPDWTNPSINPEIAPWIAEIPNDPFSAYCKVCKKKFSLSNMGKQAVTSHTQSSKHKSMYSYSKQMTVLNFFSKPAELENSITSADSPKPSTSSSMMKERSLSNFIVPEDTLKAEIVWAMKLVVSHVSLNSFNDAAEIFAHMFNDSNVAKKCTLGRAKMSYLISYGLAPYFNLSLQQSVKNTSYVLCFDEALNRVAQRCQMDIIIRYWCEETNRVSSRFWTSVFLGKTTAEDLFEKFKEAILNLDIKLLLQISLDGPHVNLKFLRHIKDELLSENDCKILDLGTCGLHVVHGAFQFGHKFTNWKLDAFLRAIYGLFKDSPARRATYVDVTGSSKFPLKFCAIRWVENVKVCERALEVFGNVKKYIEISHKTLPETVTCDNVNKACQDKLILAKISFFSSIAYILEPFLKKFQTPKPMVPFLHENMYNLVRQLMKKIVKSSVMQEIHTLEGLVSVDLNDHKNLLHRKNIDVGVVTLKYLNMSEAFESQKSDFLRECSNFVKETVKKIFERTSKKYAVIKAASCFNPKLLQSNTVLCEQYMNNMLHILFSDGKISSGCAERAKLQFEVLVNNVKNNEQYKSTMASFTEDMRLDDFFLSLLKKEEFPDILEVLKLVMTLSHGNASVESGFSINKDMLVENLKEESLIGLRTVYDAVKSEGGVLNVPLSKDLLQYAKSARNRYHEALQKQKDKEQKELEKEKNKRKLTDQIKILQMKKMKLIEGKSAEIADIDQQISELKKKK